MKPKYAILVLSLFLFMCLTACGGEETVSELPVSTTSVQGEAFGDMPIEVSPIQEAETTALPPEATVSSESVPAEPPADFQDHTEAAVTAAIICDAVDMLPYTSGDDQYLWRAVGYLAGQIGFDSHLITDEDGFGKITSETAMTLAYAIDGNFSGELPVVTEEDPLISKAEDGGYLINMLDQGSLELIMTENRVNSTDDTFTEEAELFRDGDSLGTYTVTLRNYTGPNGRYFGYSIAELIPSF